MAHSGSIDDISCMDESEVRHRDPLLVDHIFYMLHGLTGTRRVRRSAERRHDFIGGSMKTTIRLEDVGALR
jgi:hypothetical protein